MFEVGCRSHRDQQWRFELGPLMLIRKTSPALKGLNREPKKDWLVSLR